VSEIKSTLDIVLQKTKHLTLSEDEKQAQKKKEARQNLAGLLQKYQDKVLDIDQLKDNLNELKEFFDFIDIHALVSEILNRIELDNDNTSFMVILDDICQADSDGLKAVLSEYQKTVRMRRDQRSDQLIEKLIRDYLISGSAVLPNLGVDDEWAADLQTIYTDYNRILSREKAALMKG
jgi:predicted RNase H-like nuclease (RuvC/YqgF family)